MLVQESYLRTHIMGSPRARTHLLKLCSYHQHHWCSHNSQNLTCQKKKLLGFFYTNVYHIISYHIIYYCLYYWCSDIISYHIYNIVGVITHVCWQITKYHHNLAGFPPIPAPGPQGHPGSPDWDFRNSAEPTHFTRPALGFSAVTRQGTGNITMENHHY